MKEKERLFIKCSLFSEESGAAALSQLSSWMTYSEQHEVLDAWNEWIKDALAAIAARMEGHRILIDAVYGWIGEMPDLSDEWLRFAADNLVPAECELTFSRCNFADVLRRSNVSHDDKARAFLLFLKCKIWDFTTYVDESLGEIDLAQVNEGVIREIKDELVRQKCKGQNVSKVLNWLI